MAGVGTFGWGNICPGAGCGLKTEWGESAPVSPRVLQELAGTCPLCRVLCLGYGAFQRSGAELTGCFGQLLWAEGFREVSRRA